MTDDEKLFRFQDLEVWQRAADLAIDLGHVADHLEERRRYRYAEQLRAAAISISNNIAEGSGSTSKDDFRKFLNYARRSAFECANMLLILQRRELTGQQNDRVLLVELSRVCRMITSLGRSL
jgi:four helix bundle protein